MRRVFCSGITGQDGSYLAELLISKGYEVHGLIRRASSFNTGRLEQIYQDPHVAERQLILHYGDMTDSGRLTNLIYEIQPELIFHMAAMSHVRVSFDIPEYTCDVGALGTLHLLEAVRRSGIKTRIYNASSSEQFGSSPPPQNEETPFKPRSPYAVAKVFAHWMCQNYREAYDMFICNGILFNHESNRRGETFVTRKITRAIAEISAGRQEYLYLGNLDAKRDWGYAPEFMTACYLMLQQDMPDDYVIGTGESHSVREFVNEAFAYAELDPDKYVRIDPRYYRPLEVEDLVADYSKAKRVLGWSPKVTFKELVRIMVDADLGVKYG